MDRNTHIFVFNPITKVALRKESVDRNTHIFVFNPITKLSLSARRAWIEILFPFPLYDYIIVALRKESVDRNQQGRNGQNIKRRVALRKESVDRNNGRFRTIHNTESRSPQGERG